MKEPSPLAWPRGYRYLLLARANSSVILRVDFTLIFSALTYFWHAEATTIGIASALYGLPGLLLGPFFGRLADRHPPLIFLRYSYLARSITSLCLLLAPNAWIFVFFVLLKGLSNLGAMPAEQVLIRMMLTPGQFVDNARWMTLIDQGIKIMAPLLAAVIAGLHVPLLGFAFSATLALFGVMLLLLLAHVGLSADDNTVKRTQPRVLDLWNFLARHREFRNAFIASLVQTLTLGLYDPMLALFLRAQGFAASTFGEIVSCTAAGGIIGALLFRRILATWNMTCVSTAGLIGFGVTVLLPGAAALAGAPLGKEALFIIWLANGACFGITEMTFGVVMQTASPPQALGTISATARSAQLAALVIGPLIGSSAISVVSLPTLFVISGTFAIGSGALVGLMR
ncbi:MFS family permease [Robbsia andropogonis]|uniref:MFS transporter n=2 Tax=Robbsia andropogonis TaxID=28092 RepID=UPI0020A05F6D|nr:MFS transporter [Robbsia andropogonis]MCP1118973.1 MFS transporter [Robbsia andropogonis]MCP1128675.1 MFS transporter [Robbsia andropogonis]